MPQLTCVDNTDESHNYLDLLFDILEEFLTGKLMDDSDYVAFYIYSEMCTEVVGFTALEDIRRDPGEAARFFENLRGRLWYITSPCLIGTNLLVA
jgi:hypothetical protein